MRRLVICNPQARVSRWLPAERYVRQRLEQAGLAAEVVLPPDRHSTVQAARQAAEAGYEQVVAAGGDGTVNAVAEGLAGSGTPLGLLPLGTGNVLAHNLGVPTVSRALAALREHRIRSLDLGWVNERCFVALAGVGFDAHVVSRVLPGPKHLLGRHAYLFSGLAERCLHEPRQFRVAAQDESGFRFEGSAWMALVCNAPLFTWDLPLAAQAHMSDGWLDLLVFRHLPAWRFMAQLGAALSQAADAGGLPGVLTARVQAVEVDITPPWGWEVDGEPGGQTPAPVRVQPDGLQVIGASP